MITVILKTASESARQTLEKMMKTKNDEKTFIERMIDDGKAEGKTEGKAEAVLKLLDRRGLAPSEDQRQTVASCTDMAQLDVWFDRAITAATADEVFAD
jgi:hypothetical protein